MAFRRGVLIRELLSLLWTLDTKEAKTVKDISVESGMGLRQAYRWLEALDQEGLIESFDNMPARYRLKPKGSKLKRGIRR